MHATLVALELLAASVWVGGLAVIGVVAGCAREQLGPTSQVAFFRSLGRRYLRVGGGALAVAYAAGAVLLSPLAWSTLEIAIVTTAGALLVVTSVAVAQARSLTRLRAATLAGSASTSDRELLRRGMRASALRGLIVILTVALVVLAAVSSS